MKRYVVCDIIGDGTINDSYRPAVADVPGVNWSGEIPTDPNTGQPTSPWALVIVAAPNLVPVLARAGVDVLPDVALDMKVSAIHVPTKNAMKTALGQRGIATGFVDGTDGFREVVRHLGRLLNPAFDENSLDVSE